MSAQVRLKLIPRARCLDDDPVQVKVSGLKSRQVVAMRARSTDERGVVFSSSATYRADGNGEIDLNKDASLCGSYYGVELMGLLWSMRFYQALADWKIENQHVGRFPYQGGHKLPFLTCY